MNGKTLSTFEHEMKNSKFKKDFDKSYKTFTLSESLTKVTSKTVRRGTQTIDERDAILITLFITYGRIFAKNFDLPKINIKDLKCNLTDDGKLFMSL